jgi:hypothetical protein
MSEAENSLGCPAAAADAVSTLSNRVTPSGPVSSLGASCREAKNFISAFETK